MKQKYPLTDAELRDLTEKSDAATRQSLHYNISEAESFARRTLELTCLTEDDRKYLLIALENIQFGSERLSHALGKLQKSDMQAYSSILNAVHFLTSGFALGYSRSSLPKSATISLGLKQTDKARGRFKEKRKHRDEILSEVLGPLLEKGLKGEKLRSALIEAFAREKITDPKRATPGLRRVQDWAKEYREQGMWRPNAKS